MGGEILFIPLALILVGPLLGWVLGGLCRGSPAARRVLIAAWCLADLPYALMACHAPASILPITGVMLANTLLLVGPYWIFAHSHVDTRRPGARHERR